MYRFIWVLLLLQGICAQLEEQSSNDPIPNDSYEEICPSQIYCHGELLDDVQSLRLFPDSKTFVDMKLKRDEKDIIEAYKELKENCSTVDREQMLNFIQENFEEDKLLEWIPPDYSDYPLLVNTVRDNNYKMFVLQVNSIWKQLARKVSEDVKQNPQLYSSIYLPNGFFIAGGRFTEMYYWDTYWIVEGALLCGMQDTVKGILKNMLYLVKKYGYMLNGSRVYYAKRSQPPLLIRMIHTYYMFTNDIEFIINYIKYMEQELNFWLQNRTVAVEKAGNIFIMARYNTRTYGPRPESYYEDKNLTSSIPDEEGKNKVYSALKSAAESGWDFSTRHFNNEGQNDGGLLKTDPQNLIYVDLNSILQSNCAILANFFNIIGDQNKTQQYNTLAQRFQVGIDTLLWNEQEGMWLDYDLKTKTSRNYFYGSNLAPLWTGSYNKLLSKFYGDKTVEYLYKNGIINNDLSPALICVPTSLYKSGEQWDFPNCWPPLQSMAIFGLDKTESDMGKKVAFNLANSWVQTNYQGYQLSQHMYEKYSSIEFGKSGNGGEYVPQTGFGWTNGLLFHIFNKWGNVLES